MNSFTVEINEECAEVTVTTGIWATEQVVHAMVDGLRRVMEGNGPDYFTVVPSELQEDCIPIEEGSPLYVIVSGDAHQRVVLTMYNTYDLSGNQTLRILEYITGFAN